MTGHLAIDKAGCEVLFAPFREPWRTGCERLESETEVKLETAATKTILEKSGNERWAQRVIHGNYYPHIDGLRSLAVLPVLFYHLRNNICPGGFTGVDVFFAISGYLICGGIVRDLRAGSFSLVSFYFRRIRRIFPAYFVVVLSVLAAGIILYHWARIVPLARTALFSSFFSTNLYFWLDMGYFQPDAHDNPLLHLWSLGVEEQFYIVIPIALLLLWRVKPQALFPAISLCFIGSLALCLLFGPLGQSTTAFYVLPTRGWELLAGALIAILPRPKESAAGRLFAALGIVLLVISYGCLSTAETFGDRGTRVAVMLPFFGNMGLAPFPGWVTLPSIMGSLILLHYGKWGPVGRLLCSKPLVAVGKISYSLYLWHWPVIVFTDYITYDRRQSLFWYFVIITISFLAAYLSWRWVEMPFRLSRRFNPQRAFISVGVACSALAALTVILISTDGLRNILHLRANAYASPPRSFVKNFEKFVPLPAFQPPAYPAIDHAFFRRIGTKDLKPTFCLIGDSHAEALAPGMDTVAAELHQSGLYLSRRMDVRVVEGSNSLMQRLLEWVAENPDIRDVYLVCRWNYMYGILEGIPRLGDKGRIPPISPSLEKAAQMEADFRTTASWFSRHGKRVFVFTSVPEYGYAPADIAARREIIPLKLPIDMTLRDYNNRQASVLRTLETLQKEGLLTVIPLHAAFFYGEESLVMSDTGKPYYSDTHHITAEGAEHAIRILAPMLWPISNTNINYQTNPISN
jgi:peptidoglycan/LPS O-acetylase OafA/YrhL